MKPSTVVRLALAGSRTDTLRVALTAGSTGLGTLILLGAATIATGTTYRYLGDLFFGPGDRAIIVVGLLSLTVPVLSLAAQCGRLGAPARDRRLAALRLNGATPRQVIAIAAAETGLASLFGSGAGTVTYLVGATIAHAPDAGGLLPLPTDAQPSPGLVLVLSLVAPVISLGIAAVLLRRVVIGPFGIVRHTHPGKPHWWPFAMVTTALAALLALGPRGLLWDHVIPESITFGPFDQDVIMPGVLVGGLLSTCVGVGLSAGWIAHTGGRILCRHARRPSTLIAGRRLMDDPWSGSRTLGTLLVSVLLGASSAVVRSYVAGVVNVQNAVAQGPYDFRPGDNRSVFAAMALFDLATVVAILIAASALLVSLVEKALAHRRTYAALVATGTPRSVLARVAVWQVATPVLPALVIALAIGAGYLRLVTGTHVTIRRLAFRGLDLSLDPGEDLPHHGRLAQPGRARQPQERNRRVHRASIGRHRSRQRPVLHAPRVGRFSFGPRQRRAL